MATPDSQHPHWMWNKGAVPPGPTVIVDMDGVISDAGWRQYFLESSRPNWDDFFENCGNDEPFGPQVRMFEMFDPDIRIVLLTARPFRVQPQTLNWLEKHQIPWDLLIMRGARDNRSSRAYKQAESEALQADGFDLRLAFEDDPRNAQMFNDIGIPCVYIHSGYYE